MPNATRIAWSRTLLQLVLLLAAGALAGRLSGSAWAGLAIAALLALAWHLSRLSMLLKRLRSGRHVPAKRPAGIWAELEHLLHRRQTGARQRRRRLAALLRAYRAAATVLPDAIVVVERANQRIVWFNEAGTSLLGLHYPDDIGTSIVARLRPLPLVHWLARGRDAEPLDAPSP
ncbi:MAG: DUF3329 domain-containing protein, partial [Lysobacter sp.]